MNPIFFHRLEAAERRLNYGAFRSGRVIGKLKDSKDPDEILHYKYHLGKYFAIKFSKYMIWRIMGRYNRFREFDEYMVESEIAFAKYCNALGQTTIGEMELMFFAIVEQFNDRYENINAARFPDFAAIVKGKRNGYRNIHDVFIETGVYELSHKPSVLYE